MPHGDPHCHSIIIAVIQPDPDGVSAERWLRQQALGCQQQPHDGYGWREGQVPASTTVSLGHRLGLRKEPYAEPSSLESRPVHCKNADGSNEGDEYSYHPLLVSTGAGS